jgi:hypothetical protein
MAVNTLIFKKMQEEFVPTTSTAGEIIYTDKGSCYVVASTGQVVKTTDMIFVETLPTTGQIKGKFYLVNSNSTIQCWTGSAWKSYGSPSYVMTAATATNLGGILSGGDLSVASNGIVTVNTGTNANQIVRLDATDKLPTIDGSQLTGLTKTQVGLTNVTNDSQVKRSEMGTASGVATLDASGKVPLSQISVTGAKVQSVANQTARLALASSANLQIVIQVDTNKVWGLNPNLDPTIISNWVDMGSSASNVASVNGATGAVTITSTTVGLANVTNNKQVKAITSNVDKNVVTWSGTTGDTVTDSGKAICTGDIVGTTDTQTLTNKNLTSVTNKFGTIAPNADSTTAIKLTVSDGTSAIATVDTTNKKFVVNNCLVLPVLTTTQRNALTGLIGGETVFDSTIDSMMTYDGSFWVQQ